MMVCKRYECSVAERAELIQVLSDAFYKRREQRFIVDQPSVRQRFDSARRKFRLNTLSRILNQADELLPAIAPGVGRLCAIPQRQKIPVAGLNSRSAVARGSRNGHSQTLQFSE